MDIKQYSIYNGYFNPGPVLDNYKFLIMSIIQFQQVVIVSKVGNVEINSEPVKYKPGCI